MSLFDVIRYPLPYFGDMDWERKIDSLPLELQVYFYNELRNLSDKNGIDQVGYTEAVGQLFETMKQKLLEL